MGQRVALLTNFIPPYRLPLYKAIADRVEDFQVFISTEMEPNRQWQPNWEDLKVTVQNNITLKRTWQHPHGFAEDLYVHIPYDTIWTLRQYQPDVVISGELGLRSVQAAIYRKLTPQSKLILWATISEYSEQGRGKLREKLRQILVPQADAILVNGSSGGRYIHQFGISPQQIFAAPYTTNISPFLAVPLSRREPNAYRLLYVGQLLERKGIAPFLSALARWGGANPERAIEFWIVGEGPLRDTLEKILMPSNVTVKFLGSVAYADLPEIYRQGGIFVFPTLADEWGVVVNEAMAAGLPVLGSLYSQAVEELVVDGVTGWTFRPDRPEELLAALDRVFSTPPDSLERIRVKDREQIQYLTPEFVADRVLEAINYVSQKHQP